MNLVIQTLFNFSINLGESILFIYLISNKLIISKTKQIIIICCFLETTIATLLNLFLTNSNLRIIILLLVDIAITYFLSNSSFPLTIFWGSTYIIICIFADTFTFILGELLTSSSAFERFYSYPINNFMTLIYFFFCFFSVFLLTRKNTQTFSFPSYIQIIFIGLTILGILTVESLLDLLINLNTLQNAEKQTLYFSISIFLLILFILIILINQIGKLYQKNLELIEKNRQKQFEQQQYDLLIQTNELLRTWKHDFQHHVNTLQILMQKKDYSELEIYLNSLTSELQHGSWQIRTGNTILDAVLSSKNTVIKKYNISLTHSIFLPPLLPISNLEFTSLLGNLLDNAIEACKLIKDTDKRYINIEIKPFNQSLCINCSNNFNGKILYNSSNKLLSTKTEIGHGIGLKRIEQIVTQANGFLHIYPEKNIFKITIIIPLEAPTPKSKT